MNRLDRLLYGRLMITADEDGGWEEGEPIPEPTPEPTNRNQIDQSQVSGDGIYKWRPVANLYGLANGYKVFCIYNGELYKATVDVVTDTNSPDNNSSFEEFKPSGVTVVTGAGIKGDGTADNPIDADVSLESDNILFIDGSGQLYVSKTVIEDLIDNKVDNIDTSIVTGFGIDGSGKDGDPLEVALADDENNIIVGVNNALIVNKQDIKNIVFTAMQNVEIDSNVANIRSHRILTLKFNDPDDTRLYAYETVTKLEFDSNTNELVYTDEKVEETRIPIASGSGGASKFTELTDTPTDISQDGKMLITSGNKLILSDLPSECGIVANYPTSIFIRNGSEFSVNDVQQFINQAVEKIPLQRTYGYVSVKCIDPKFELFPINKGLIEYVKSYSAVNGYAIINGLKQEFELIDNYKVRDFDDNVIQEFKDVDDNQLTVYAVIQDGYKRLINSGRGIYDLNSDGKYESTGASVGSNLLTYEISLCGKYVVGKSDSYKLKICEFTDSSTTTTTDTEIVIDNIDAGGYSHIYPNHNMVDDLIFGKYYDDTKRVKLYNVKLDLINKTLISSTELFDIEIPEGVKYYSGNYTTMAYDRSIFTFCGQDGKLKLIVKDSDNSYRLVRTDLTVYPYYGMAISNDNYLIIGYSNTQFYKINLAPSLLCVNQRVENIVTTYSKEAIAVSLMSATKYAITKSDGVYTWDITSDTETKVYNEGNSEYIKSISNKILFDYASNGVGILDEDGTVLVTMEAYHKTGNIQQTQDGFIYTYMIDNAGGSGYDLIVKDQDINEVYTKVSVPNLYALKLIDGNITGARVISGNDTDFYFMKIENDELIETSYTVTDLHASIISYEQVNDVAVVAYSYPDSNGDTQYAIKMFCIEDFNNVVPTGTFEGRKFVDALYDSSLNSIVSIDGDNNIVLLDYDR